MPLCLRCCSRRRLHSNGLQAGVLLQQQLMLPVKVRLQKLGVLVGEAGNLLRQCLILATMGLKKVNRSCVCTSLIF